ncbi:long-chain fatty acid--CoA ligase [Cryobacterium frigoriphilum]|uniref:Long-chain fatty acid--CoA ligase n=1 Tax=Cryobacterium frigoriphilum TaxID=1259150 RepID=A0A4R9AAW8_9MICO|nr:class I adenylate-forming enzyme family protein [Cryobacterium frigoriphilum]TFD55154.1 long-chain fatty acid--CoA ligase [Cryobacterium frigoriphilum]
MPFLNQLQHWAAVRPDAIAVDVATEAGPQRISYRDLRDRATARLGALSARPLTVLCEPNGIDCVVGLAAAIAAGRSCAVLDPGWPATQRAAVEARLRDLPELPEPRERPATILRDGPPDSVFLYGFTSGTTSVPKAFSRTRGSWPLMTTAAYFQVTEADVTLAPGPLSAGLSLYALAESLAVGGRFVTLPHLDVAAAVAAVRDRGVTRLVAVPAVLRLIVARAEASGVCGDAVTGIVSGGALLDPAVRAQLRAWAPNATLHEYYGAAELSFVSVSVLRPGDSAPDAAAASAVGRAFPGVTVRIRSESEPDRHIALGRTAGTIYVRSPLVSSGYVWGDDGTAFERDGDWCTVGDQGFLDSNGVLHYLGRRADMIVTAGGNVYPQAVEAALAGVPGVDTVVATGLTDAARGTRLVVAVLANSAEATLPRATLRAAATALLAEPHRPRGYYRLTELPLTPAGKLSRQLLCRWIEEGDDRVSTLE